jgi:hypothetical protein
MGPTRGGWAAKEAEGTLWDPSNPINPQTTKDKPFQLSPQQSRQRISVRRRSAPFASTYEPVRICSDAISKAETYEMEFTRVAPLQTNDFRRAILNFEMPVCDSRLASRTRWRRMITLGLGGPHVNQTLVRAALYDLAP